MKTVVVIGNPSKNAYMVGGAENQLLQLSKELMSRGNRVCLMGHIDPSTADKQYEYFRISGNWVSPVQWLKMLKLFNRLKPQVVISRASDPLMPIFTILTLLSRAGYYYFAAHDWELSPKTSPRLKSWRWLSFWFGLQFTKRIFVQNGFQLEGFKNLLVFGKNRVRKTNNLPLLKPIPSFQPSGQFFTWIGSYRPHKRAEWVIELAKMVPEKLFRVVVDCHGKEDIEKQFNDAARELDNFEFIPGLSREELIPVYRDASAILITSEGEGFPNVAIEAWSQGRFVISTPSHAVRELSENKAVQIAESLDEFSSFIRSISLIDIEVRGRNALSHFKKNFSASTIVGEILRD